MLYEYFPGKIQFSKHHGRRPIFGREPMLCSGVNGHRTTSEQVCDTLDKSHSPDLGVGNGRRTTTVHSPLRRSTPNNCQRISKIDPGWFSES
jgi:hypothetical protein